MLLVSLVWHQLSPIERNSSNDVSESGQSGSIGFYRLFLRGLSNDALMTRIICPAIYIYIYIYIYILQLLITLKGLNLKNSIHPLPPITKAGFALFPFIQNLIRIQIILQLKVVSDLLVLSDSAGLNFECTHVLSRFKIFFQMRAEFIRIKFYKTDWEKFFGYVPIEFI